MSKEAAQALEGKLRTEHRLPHNGEIAVTYVRHTNSLEVRAEISDELDETCGDEVYAALCKIVPETFSHEGINWDVDNGGVHA